MSSTEDTTSFRPLASKAGEGRAPRRRASPSSHVAPRPSRRAAAVPASPRSADGAKGRGRAAKGVVLRRALVALGLVALAALFLYEPARDLYVAKRQEGVLAAQLASIDSQNDALSDSVSSLTTREGIEDEARKRGYVTSGDTAVTVDGLDDSTDTSSSGAASSTTANDASDSTDEPWYVSALDFVFDYQPSS